MLILVMRSCMRGNDECNAEWRAVDGHVTYRKANVLIHFLL